MYVMRHWVACSCSIPTTPLAILGWSALKPPRQGAAGGVVVGACGNCMHGRYFLSINSWTHGEHNPRVS